MWVMWRRTGAYYYQNVGPEHDKHGVSPVLNVRQPSIILSQPIPDAENEYKLSLLDEDIEVTITDVKVNGVDVRIHYSVTGKYAENITRVIAVITEEEFSDRTGWWTKLPGDNP